MKASLAAIACAALALSGCKGESKRETGGTAGGEILPGSASDAMLPYDTVRSQAPLAPKEEGGESGKDKQGEAPEGEQASQAATDDAAQTPTASAEPAKPEE